MSTRTRLTAALMILTLAVTTLVGSPASAKTTVAALQNGADVSWLPEIERAGSKFYDAKGRKIDPLVLMKK